MPFGRQERRGSQIRAEHLAWANVISQSGHARHMGTPRLKKVGNPELAHIQMSPLPAVLRRQSPKSGLDQQEKVGRPWCLFTGQNTSLLIHE